MPIVRRRTITRGTPFRFPLRNDFPGREGKLMRLVHDGRVVRVSPGWKESDLADLHCYTAQLRRDGILVPQYDVVCAPRWDRPEKPAMYVVTESISGERLDEIAPPARLDWQLPVSRGFYNLLYGQLDDFICALTQHYARMLVDGGLVFKAMDESQFLYGTTRKDRHPHIYFVDLDPTYTIVPSAAAREPGANLNDLKTYFEKPINVLFEMQIHHPEAGFHRSYDAVRNYFATCSCTFQDFYSAQTPWWAKTPNFERYQRMKSQLLGA